MGSPEELPAVIKGDGVRCPYCATRIMELKYGPGEVELFAWGGPVVERKQLEAGQCLPYFLPGYTFREEDNLWALDNHARKVFERQGQPGHRHHGEYPRAPASYPTRIECFRCGEKCTLDRPPQT